MTPLTAVSKASPPSRRARKPLEQSVDRVRAEAYRCTTPACAEASSGQARRRSSDDGTLAVDLARERPVVARRTGRNQTRNHHGQLSADSHRSDPRGAADSASEA